MRPAAFSLALLVVALFGPSCFADTTGKGVFVDALVFGHASTSIDKVLAFAPVLATLKSSTGSTGEITVSVNRVVKFSQQPHCGRVAFSVVQESSKTTWANMGGQMNICEDGAPPWQACSGMFETLVRPGSTCPDGTKAHPTEEVENAVRAAIAAGGKTPEEVSKELHSTFDKRPAAEKEERK